MMLARRKPRKLVARRGPASWIKLSRCLSAAEKRPKFRCCFAEELAGVVVFPVTAAIAVWILKESPLLIAKGVKFV